MAFFSRVYSSEFWKPDGRWFFQLILICFIHTYNIKVKNPMDFLVWVGKIRSTLCADMKKLAVRYAKLIWQRIDLIFK